MSELLGRETLKWGHEINIRAREATDKVMGELMSRDQLVDMDDEDHSTLEYWVRCIIQDEMIDLACEIGGE